MTAICCWVANAGAAYGAGAAQRAGDCEISANPAVGEKLYHPSLPENQGHEIAARQQKGFGAMLSFELDGDEQTLRRFLSGLSLFTLAESLGEWKV
ncbi:PLP-dependent transferase [Escherichia coli]